MDKTTILQLIEDQTAAANSAFLAVKTLAELADFETTFVGKTSPFLGALKQLKNLAPEDKRKVGPLLQKSKESLETQIQEKRSQLEAAALNQQLEKDAFDVTKTWPQSSGGLHPISIIQRNVEEVFAGLGFTVVDGPEVETEWHNFEALNIPDTHPARDMQDTFFVKTGQTDPKLNSVLRTHTSNLQIRSMLKHGAPIRVIAPGRVFRNEDVDATHDASFYQVEGLMVDETGKISVSNLKAITETMLSAIFKKDIKTRIRPGYFPFVEPGLEVDIWWEYTDKNGQDQSKWLEFMGAGMVHPEVLKASNVDSEKYTGFAFGFGLTRLAMMRYGIEDIRLLFSHKKDFLQQF